MSVLSKALTPITTTSHPASDRFGAHLSRGFYVLFCFSAEDGNVVVALGRRPPSDPDVSAATPSKAHVLWESGPIRSLELSSGGPSKKRACRLCKLHVSKDGSMLVVQGFEKLAAFSPSTVEALETIFMVDKASQE